MNANHAKLLIMTVCVWMLPMWTSAQMKPEVDSGLKPYRSSGTKLKLVEYRTPVKVGSPAVSTKEACKTKPLPGVKTADRFFRLDYSPDDAVVKYGLTSGLMAGIDRNQRGEVVFKLTRLFTLTPPHQETSKDQRKVPDIIPSLNSSSNLGKEKLPKDSRP